MKHLAISLSILISSAVAQYTGEPVSLVSAPTPYPALGATAVGGTAMYQVRLTPHASLPANTYYACLTIGKTGATYALQTGTFNTATGVYTKNTDIDAVNAMFSTSELFALSVTNDLLTAAFDAGTGVRYATRATPSGPFTLQPGLVTGITGTYVDPIFGRVNGQDVLFYAAGGPAPFKNISYGTWTAGAVTNVKVVADTTQVGGTQLHSACPFNDSTGTTRSLMFIGVNGASYTLYFTSLLEVDAGAPPKPIFNSPVWIENGDATGGSITLITAASTPAYTVPLRIGISAVNSTTVPASVGGPLNITSFGPLQAPAATPWVGVTLLGNLATAPIVPGGIVVGNLSLTSVAILPFGAFSNSTGIYQQNYPGPGLPLGTKVYHQTALCDTTNWKIYLSNTGKIEWK